jgi:hypothetical protein
VVQALWRSWPSVSDWAVLSAPLFEDGVERAERTDAFMLVECWESSLVPYMILAKLRLVMACSLLPPRKLRAFIHCALGRTRWSCDASLRNVRITVPTGRSAKMQGQDGGLR